MERRVALTQIKENRSTTPSCCIAWTALELALQPKLVSRCWILLLESHIVGFVGKHHSPRSLTPFLTFQLCCKLGSRTPQHHVHLKHSGGRSVYLPSSNSFYLSQQNNGWTLDIIGCNLSRWRIVATILGDHSYRTGEVITWFGNGLVSCLSALMQKY